jgi:hypothetical protein
MSMKRVLKGEKLTIDIWRFRKFIEALNEPAAA